MREWEGEERGMEQTSGRGVVGMAKFRRVVVVRWKEWEGCRACGGVGADGDRGGRRSTAFPRGRQQWWATTTQTFT